MFDNKNFASMLIAAGVAVLLVIGFGFDPIGVVIPDQEASTSEIPTATATVTRVVDGDTVDVRIGSSSDTVRLIGVDAPEIRWPSADNGLDQPRAKECFALTSWQFLQDMLRDKQIRLVGDPLQPVRDKYGRRLAYVYVGDKLVNKSILLQGFAKEITVGGGYRKQASFRKAERKSRANNRGLWSSCK